MAATTFVRRSLARAGSTAHHSLHTVLLLWKIRGIHRHIDAARLAAVEADGIFMDASRGFLRRFPPRRSLAWHTAYAAANERREPEYIPENAFYLHLEPRVNPRATALLYSDKNMYDHLFAGAALPATLGRVTNGRCFSPDYRPLSAAELASELRAAGGQVVAKPSVESGGGRNVRILSGGELERVLAEEIGAPGGENLLFQRFLRQHAQMAAFHPESLNTLRVATFRLRREIVVLSAVLRMGVGAARVDNQAAGGISCGVDEQGRLRRFAYDKHFQRFAAHPTTGRAFDGHEVPGYAAACALARELHERLPAFGMVSWDLAIDEAGAPVLIESNLRYQEINFLQLNNGPLFGRYTEEVMALA